MNRLIRRPGTLQRAASWAAVAGTLLIGAGCATSSDDDYWNDRGDVSTSVSVGVGYGYYGPAYYGGYYGGYPPVVVVPPGPGARPPGGIDGGNRPTTLPADAGPSPKASTRASTAPPRPASASRPTSRPSPRPAPRPMPRGRR